MSHGLLTDWSFNFQSRPMRDATNILHFTLMTMHFDRLFLVSESPCGGYQTAHGALSLDPPSQKPKRILTLPRHDTTQGALDSQRPWDLDCVPLITWFVYVT